MVKAGIVGGAGYTGGETIRLLLRHPQCALNFVQSRSQAGKNLTDVHTDLIGETGLNFSAGYSEDVDVLFLCLGHGESKLFLNENKISSTVKIIDLSQDFRLTDSKESGFVYGLPEVFREEIKSAQNVANPGCFATAIELALLPMAAAKNIKGDVHVSGITGSTGAGQKPTDVSHFSWRSSNISTYKAFEHQHLMEINKTLSALQGTESNIYFIPFRGTFTRGILVCAYLKTDLPQEKVTEIYKEFYASHPFVNIVHKNPDVKQVLNTNKCLLFIEKHKDIINIVSVIDNLVKGASGQAVQNMNLMFGLEETDGLLLKPVAF
jgi:N-acetyl-gamma-glutamyl-phosphate reductase